MRASIVLLLAGLIGGSPLSIALSQTPVQETSLPAQQGGTTETHRVLVVPIDLRGRTPPAVDPQQIAAALFGGSDSVASRYRALSYGKVEFVGSARDVVDPVTLSEPADFCSTGLGRLAGAAENELRRRTVPLAAYQHVVFVLPNDAPCWWTGLGDIGGNRVWVKATTAKALQHELGHNLGMDHAVYWRRSDAEASDFMGSGSAGLNAPHVAQMGWLAPYPGKVVEVTRDADLTLEALEADPRQTELAKVAIVRPAPGANTYYLSYRASSVADPLPDAFTRGLNIHIFDAARATGGLTYFVASLTDGAEYRDGPLIVRQVSHSEGKRMTVHISFAGTERAIPGGPPPAPPGTVQSLASGKCLDLPGGETRDGTPLIQYDCHGGPNQQWRIETAGDSGSRIVSGMSGKCVGAGAAGAPVVEAVCGASPAQLWAVLAAGAGSVLRNLASGLCLDVPGASTANGVKPIAFTCNGGSNQTWRYLSRTAP